MDPSGRYAVSFVQTGDEICATYPATEFPDTWLVEIGEPDENGDRPMIVIQASNLSRLVGTLFADGTFFVQNAIEPASGYFSPNADGSFELIIELYTFQASGCPLLRFAATGVQLN